MKKSDGKPEAVKAARPAWGEVRPVSETELEKDGRRIAWLSLRTKTVCWPDLRLRY